MITLSRTASCCDDSLLETLHWFIGSWLSPSSTNYWSEETVCRVQIYPICSVDLILFLINTLKVCQPSAKKTRNDQLKHLLQHMMLFHIIMETWHLDTAIFYFLLLLFIFWSAAILNKQSSKQMLGFCPFSFFSLLIFFSCILIKASTLLNLKLKSWIFPHFFFFFFFVRLLSVWCFWLKEVIGRNYIRSTLVCSPLEILQVQSGLIKSGWLFFD